MGGNIRALKKLSLYDRAFFVYKQPYFSLVFSGAILFLIEKTNLLLGKNRWIDFYS